MTMSAPSGPGSTNPIKIFANIFISFIGAGVLGLPYAFKEAGILEGIMVMSCVAFISIKAMLLIVACKHRLIQKESPSNLTAIVGPELKAEIESLIQVNGNGHVDKKDNKEHKPAAGPSQDIGYGDVGYYALGNAGKLLVELSIVVSQIGFCCAYLIFISENLSSYLTGMKLSHWLFILLPPLALLCLLRHLSSLALSSLFAQMSTLMAFAVVFWFDFEHLHTVKIHPKEFSLEGLPFFLCMAIYCYEGAGMILSLESSLDSSVRSKFTKYFVLTLILVTMLYITFGVCGYLSFGPETNPIITLNLPKGQSLDFAIVVKSCLCLSLFFTYPVMMFPVISILEPKLLPNRDSVWQGNLLRVGMVSVTGLVVMGIPNFAHLMALVGATCCTMLAFILPGLFHLKLFSGSLTKCEKAFDYFLIVLGIIGTVIGLIDAFQRMNEDARAAENTGLALASNATGSHASSVATTLPPVVQESMTTAVKGAVAGVRNATAAVAAAAEPAGKAVTAAAGGAGGVTEEPVSDFFKMVQRVVMNGTQAGTGGGT